MKQFKNILLIILIALGIGISLWALTGYMFVELVSGLEKHGSHQTNE